eukprot:symbB.v1.2.030692.t2/scaffold3489.1/size55649/1
MATLGVWRRPLRALRRQLTTVSLDAKVIESTESRNTQSVRNGWQRLKTFRRSQKHVKNAASLVITGNQGRNDGFLSRLEEELQGMRAAGTFKVERVLESPQSGAVTVAGGSKPVLNFCANNYLGLSSHPSLVQAAQETLSSHGFGLSSVRFICGTQDVHKQLEAAISKFHGTEDTILFPSCFDANAGLFEACLGPEDAVISDALNHASIIDGIRLCKAQRHRYNHMDMAHLEEILKECVAKGTRQRMIVTDGVFSMDGDIAPLREICDLADKYEAQVFVDECHATGFLGVLVISVASGLSDPMWWEIRPQSRDRYTPSWGEKLADGLAGLLVGGGLGATAGTISLLGFKPELRMKQARAIVPQAAFFVGSALALAQVAFLKEPMFLGPWHMELARLLK